MTKVINLWAGPGAGKSTTAAGLFFFMKNAGHKCELVTERAKELCYENKLKEASKYDMLLEQYKRQARLIDKVDWIITDSPLLLSDIYEPDHHLLHQEARYFWNQFDNINFYIQREKEYKKYGRDQTEQEAIELDQKVSDYLALRLKVKGCIWGNEGAPKEIMKMLRLIYD